MTLTSLIVGETDAENIEVIETLIKFISTCGTEEMIKTANLIKAKNL